MADATFETVLIERDEGTTFITLNRPEKRNAMSPQLHVDMCDALDWAEEDDQTKVVVINGAGGNFSAGQDLKLYFRETETDPKKRTAAKRAAHTWRWLRLSAFPKPTIAMVDGFCFGGGFTPVIACDFAIASNEARFGLSEVNWGNIPGGLVAWAVNQTMSYRDALYYAVTGEQFTGAEAAVMKFVNKAVPQADLRAATMVLARKLEEKSPAAVRYTKESIRSTRTMDYAQAIDFLNAKSDALRYRDPEKSRQKAMSMFLDEKSFKPGMKDFRSA